MAAVEELITDHIDIWTSAIKYKSTAGRGGGNKIELYGVNKLRELILDLAVRGLLVPQDPNDVPASELLDRINTKKIALLKEGKIKKQKSLPPIDENEKPFKLPKGWEWARLGDVTNYGLLEKIEPDDALPKTWVLELEDIEKVSSKVLKKVRIENREFRSSKNIFYKGDVIYGKLRPYLDKVVIADENGVCTTEMIPIKSYACITSGFLKLSMKSSYFKRYANNSTHGMNLPRLGVDKARLALLPVMSESEQNKVVAKVNELMALCDQLEHHTEVSIAAHQTLVETLLNALTENAASSATQTERQEDSAALDNQFEQAWQRISEHFDVLFTTDNSIEKLKCSATINLSG